MIKKNLITMVVSLILPAFSYGLSEQEYKSGIITVPIDSQDLKTKVNPKNSVEDIRAVLWEVRVDIKKAAKAFDLDPIHVAAAIAGEHAMNVDIFDSVQEYNIQRRRKKETWVNRTSDSDLSQLLAQAEFVKCNSIKSDYDYWYCVTAQWNKHFSKGLFRGLLPENQVFIKFTETYFNPNGMGSTFGLGQMSPLRALMVSDLVARRTGFAPLSFRANGDSTSAFDVILDPKKVIYYVAATIRIGIDKYKSIARFDVSTNPGITATLYNLGNERYLASKRFNENIQLLREKSEIEYPRPNKLGKWVLQNQQMLQEIVQ